MVVGIAIEAETLWGKLQARRTWELRRGIARALREKDDISPQTYAWAFSVLNALGAYKIS